MTMICECGYDCAEFVARHDIAEDALFECPACNRRRRARPEQLERPGKDAERSEPAGPPS